MSDETYNEHTESSTLGGHIEASSDAFNGWTNRETWAVALHINNDEGWQESVLEALKEAEIPAPLTTAFGEHGETPDEFDRYRARQAGEIIRENVEEVFDVQALIEGDIETVRQMMLVRDDIGSLWRVDWTALGSSFLSDLAEQEQEA